MTPPILPESRNRKEMLIHSKNLMCAMSLPVLAYESAGYVISNGGPITDEKTEALRRAITHQACQ